MRSAVKTQKKQIVLWIAAALLAIGLAGAPVMADQPMAGCTSGCIGTG